ncbi:MAG: hypothetical protein U9N81_08110 [Bacillota bacterium]|nr:hypothetical protein [Bacillota bacterium]
MGKILRLEDAIGSVSLPIHSHIWGDHQHDAIFNDPTAYQGKHSDAAINSAFEAIIHRIERMQTEPLNQKTLKQN